MIPIIIFGVTIVIALIAILGYSNQVTIALQKDLDHDRWFNNTHTKFEVIHRRVEEVPFACETSYSYQLGMSLGIDEIHKRLKRDLQLALIREMDKQGLIEYNDIQNINPVHPGLRLLQARIKTYKIV